MLKAFYNWSVMSLRLLTFRRAPRKGALILAFAKIHAKNWYFKLTGKNATKERFLGYKVDFFNYNTFLYLFEEIFMQQTYFFESKNPNPFLIDCGSNIGLSILYLKYLYPTARIVAFEPDPQTFVLLHKNITQNSLESVELHNTAISNHNGEMTFHQEAGHEGSLKMGAHASRGVTQVRKVPCTSLSPYLQQTVDFLKMDIEGAEALCFRDVEEKQRWPLVEKLILECHHNIQSQPILSEILPILEKNRFKYQISASLRAPYPENVSQDVMIYAYREN